MKSKKLLAMLAQHLKRKETPMLKLGSLVKMAKEDRNFARTLMHMAKIAADKDTETQFNETVPAASQPDKNDPNNEQQGGKVEQPMDQSQVMQDGQQATPEELQMAQEDNSPEAAGVRAAQSFIGPEVFQAAMAGDTNAMDLLSRVAGQIASSTSMAASQAASQPQMSPDMQAAGLSPEEAQAFQEQGMDGGQGQLAQTMTPEEQVANLIVAPQEQPVASPIQSAGAKPAGGGSDGPTPPGGEPKPATTNEGEKPTFPPSKKGEEKKPDDGEDDSVDSATVAKIVKLVKSGKL